MFDKTKTVPLSKFLPELRFEFQDLPDELFYFAIVRTARRLANGGDIDIRKSILHIKPYVTRYALRLPPDVDLVNIISLEPQFDYKGQLKPLNLLRGRPKNWQNYQYEGIAWYDDIDKIIHVQNYNVLADFILHISVSPLDSACELPLIYYDELIELMMLGIKATILKMDNKPWTNLQLAFTYDKAFDQGVHELTVTNHMHKTKGIFKMNIGRVM